jgi:PAS domain S-box-containing protein
LFAYKTNSLLLSIKTIAPFSEEKMTKNSNHNIGDNYKFEHFFELSADLFCIAGFDGYLKRINPAVSKLLGYTNEELLSRPISDFIYHEDKTITAKHRDDLIKSNPLLNFENRYLTKSGEIVWLSWTSMPVENDQLVFAIAKNITHKKKQEEERNLLLTNLTKNNKDLKQLTYTNSHDLRSPVNNLLAIFSILDISKITDTETLELIDMLKSTSESLKQTLNNSIDTLTQKEIENSNIEVLDLNECLQTVLRSIGSLIVNSKAVINIDFFEVETIQFNKVYLESIFLNLITNSIKYAKPDSETIISIYSKKVNGINQLIVSDTGMGFDMEVVKDKIFGLHQKFHNHIDSKGIGLYLVYNHVTSLGGHITVESKTNEGAKFTISFKD